MINYCFEIVDLLKYELRAGLKKKSLDISHIKYKIMTSRKFEIFGSKKRIEYLPSKRREIEKPAK